MAELTTLRSLRAKGAMEDTVLYDIAKTLMELIAASKAPVPLSPDTVSVDKDGLAVIPRPRDPGQGGGVHAPDLSFASPEVIFLGQKAEQTDHFFSLGLLMAWMKSGKALYEQPGGAFAYAPARQGSFSQGLVSSLRGKDASADAAALVSDPALSAIIRGLTDSIPARRHDGARALLEHLVKNMPGEATVNFVCRGKVVASRTESDMRMDIDDMLQGQMIYAADGLKYLPAAMVRIPYRPGKHTYAIEVWPVTEKKTRRNVYVKFAGPGEPALMFALDETGKKAPFQRSLARRQVVTVLAMDVDAQGQSIPAATQRLTLPASPEGKTGTLTFSCLDRGRVGVTLVDSQGVHLLAADTALTLGLPE